jgi:cell fate regulator YaaT (PSP1 superfamily)
MLKIIGVRFKSVGKIYYFDPKDYDVKMGDKVIVETARGVECGEVALVDREIDETRFTNPVKGIIRLATPNDMKTIEKNRQKEKDAFKICEQKIAAHKLKMNLIDVECTFDNNKLLFYFTAESRVDFRELVKDLAAVFRTRIELRQIGVRDEAKMLGGLGICGQPFCCSRFLGEFQPVSIKMAKEQGLSLNPTKISGTCGRLMCCLKYEQDSYEDLLKHTPKVGAIVRTADGKGIVEEVNLLTGKLRVKMDKNGDETAYKGGTVPVSIRSGAVMIRKPLKYSMLCHDFDEVISFARNDGEVHFAKAEQK